MHDGKVLNHPLESMLEAMYCGSSHGIFTTFCVKGVVNCSCETGNKSQVTSSWFYILYKSTVQFSDNHLGDTFNLPMTCYCKKSNWTPFFTFCLFECTQRVLVILIPASVQVKSDTSDMRLVPCFVRAGHNLDKSKSWSTSLWVISHLFSKYNWIHTAFHKHFGNDVT